MGSIWARAQAYRPLTPGERALLKLIEGLGAAALVAALPVIAQALAQGNVRWGDVARTALAAAAVAVLLALGKYFKAHGDPLPATLLTEATASLSGAEGSGGAAAEGAAQGGGEVAGE